MKPSHVILAIVLLAGPAMGEKPDQPASKPAPTSDLDYWLGQAKPADANSPAAPKRDANSAAETAGGPSDEASPHTSPFGSPDRAAKRFRRADALPGVVELSDGNQLPGGLYTTVEKPWIVWSEATKSWRRIDFVVVLSIEAVVEDERMELVWRWKGMGEPEKVYTGKKYPMRRVRWRFRLIDGSVIEGSTKGQPLFVEVAGKVRGPFILSERTKGKEGQTLEDLVYVRKVVVSRKMMNAVIADQAGNVKKISNDEHR